jgi:hypothetical protein
VPTPVPHSPDRAPASKPTHLSLAVEPQLEGAGSFTSFSKPVSGDSEPSSTLSGWGRSLSLCSLPRSNVPFSDYLWFDDDEDGPTLLTTSTEPPPCFVTPLTASRPPTAAAAAAAAPPTRVLRC